MAVWEGTPTATEVEAAKFASSVADQTHAPLPHHLKALFKHMLSI